MVSGEGGGGHPKIFKLKGGVIPKIEVRRLSCRCMYWFEGALKRKLGGSCKICQR